MEDDNQGPYGLLNQGLVYNQNNVLMVPGELYHLKTSPKIVLLYLGYEDDETSFYLGNAYRFLYKDKTNTYSYRQLQYLERCS